MDRDFASIQSAATLQNNYPALSRIVACILHRCSCAAPSPISLISQLCPPLSLNPLHAVLLHYHDNIGIVQVVLIRSRRYGELFVLSVFGPKIDRLSIRRRLSPILQLTISLFFELPPTSYSSLLAAHNIPPQNSLWCPEIWSLAFVRSGLLGD